MKSSTSESETGAKLIVERTSDQDIKMRGLKVLVDGAFQAVLSFGDVTELPISSGHHVIKVTNSLFSSQLEFDAVPGGTNRFSAGNVIRGLGAIMIVSLGIGPYRTFLRQNDPS